MTALVDFGPEPAWLTCPCGELTNRVPCWDCTRIADAERDQAEATNRNASTIPPGYAWAALGAPALSKRVKAQESLESLAERILAAANVVFVGPAGAGKTSLAVACLRELVSKGGIYVSAVRLGQASIQHRAGQGDAPLVELACSTPLLLLDDVGSEQNTAVNAVPPVIFQRHEQAMRTWVTTGLRFKELQERYGDGIARRISEHALVVRLGPSGVAQ